MQKALSGDLSTWLGEGGEGGGAGIAVCQLVSGSSTWSRGSRV